MAFDHSVQQLACVVKLYKLIDRSKSLYCKLLDGLENSIKAASAHDVLET